MKRIISLATFGLLALFIMAAMSKVVADDLPEYSVTGVGDDDYLNVRAKANAQSTIVTRIPFDETGIIRLSGEVNVSGQIWWEVKWQGKQGWVNKRYLKSKDGRTTAPATSASVALFCGGNEPFWGIKITKKSLEFSPMDGQKLNLPIIYNKTSENNTSIAAIYAKKDDHRITVILQKVAACSDGMSDIDYPYSVSAIINKRRFYSGCCHVK